MTVAKGKHEIIIARSLSEIERLRGFWMESPGHRDSDIDVYLMVIQSYSEVLRPHVIAIYRDGRPDAILVGRLERKRLVFRIGYSSVFSRWALCLTFVYGALHGNTSVENTQIMIHEVMNSLNRGEADVAMLEFVPLHLSLYQLALKLPSVFSRDISPTPQQHYVMLLTDSIDDIYRRMSHNRRKDLRRKIKKFQSNPEQPPRIVRYRCEADLDILFRDVETIAQKTYQRGLGAGFQNTPRVRARLRMAAERGWLRAYVLYLHDRPCAFWIGMLYRQTFVGEYVGYDPDFHQVSPGMFLMMRVIDGWCQRVDGDIVKELDFGLGHAEYKEALCDKSWLEGTVYIFAPTSRGLVLKLMRTTAASLDRAGRRLLESINLFPFLKRVWRRHLMRGENLLHPGHKHAVTVKSPATTMDCGQTK